MLLLVILFFILIPVLKPFFKRFSLVSRIQADFYIITKIILSRIIANFYFALVIIVVSYIMLFWIFPTLNLSHISGVIYQRNYGFSSLNDILTQNLILMATQSLSIILPATLTFVLFIFREQRNSFESALNNVTNNRSILIFIVISLITIGYGYHLHYLIANSVEYVSAGNVAESTVNTNFLEKKDVLENTNLQLDRIDIWLSLIILTVYFMYQMVRSMMRIINIRFILNETIKKSEKGVKCLTHSGFKSLKIRREFYQFLYFDTESIFQMSKVAIEKNMDKEFSDKLNEWSTIVSSIHNDASEINNQNNFIKNYASYIRLSGDYKQIGVSTNEYLLVKDKKLYEDYYKLILKNYISLTMILYKNHKIEEAIRSIRRVFDLYPRPRHTVEESNRLVPIFISALNELALLLLEEKSSSIKPFLERLEELIRAGNYKEKKNLLVVYKTVIIKTLEKGDIRLLTLLVYSMKKGIKEEVDKDSIEKSRIAISNAFLRINRMLQEASAAKAPSTVKVDAGEENLKEEKFFNNVFEMLVVKERDKNGALQRNTDEEKSSAVDYEELVIYLILQAILKTIETTSYSSTGFLIKFIVTNFNSKRLIETYKKFIRHPQISPYESRENTTLVMEHFNFNEHTLFYCLKKLVILLYGQQVFIDESKVEFENLPQGNYINILYLKQKELDYFYNKIIKVNNAYGLSWVTNDKFMNSLKSKLIREILVL